MHHTALVVEDEAALRIIYEFVLVQMGIEVLHAADGTQALETLEQTAPDVIFLDMLLPHVDGLTVLRYIHTAPHLSKSKVIIVTAHNRFEAEAGPDDQFLLKPILPADLRTATQRALSDL